MPMPKPQADESKDDFLSRCMGDDVMADEYPEDDQRYAVCNDLWEREKAFEPPIYQRAIVRPELKASNDSTREVLHLISTAAIDRTGDKVDPAGADISNYMRNPVVMRNHSYLTQDIIGKAVEIKVQRDGIWARTAFRKTDVGREAYALAKERLGGWSIGFRPIQHEPLKDEKGVTRGVHFTKWELLEYSQVPIPMNQDAVQSAVQRGLISREHIGYFFTVIGDEAMPTNVAADGPKAESRLLIDPVVRTIEQALRTFECADAEETIGQQEKLLT